MTSRVGADAGHGFEVEPDASALFQAVVDTSDDAVFTCDAATRITSWGRTAERIFGLPSANVLGHELRDLFAGDLGDEVHAATRRALVGERIKRIPAEVVRADGLPIPLWISMCPVDDAVGVTALVVIVTDITEQRLAQATLAEAEARLLEGEAMTHVGSWLWDVRTGAVQWSQEFHRLHDVDPLTFDGTLEAHLAVVHPQDRAQVRAAMVESVASARLFEAHYRVPLSDGEVRLVHVRAQPSFGIGGVVLGLRGIGREVLSPPDLAGIDGGADGPVDRLNGGRPGF
jgi:PAS domain S-box-containing protein